jgi:hypothetical protein
METLTEQDLEWLTGVENRILVMRKREAANTNRLCADLTMAIKKVHWIRQMLQARFDLSVDAEIEG